MRVKREIVKEISETDVFKLYRLTSVKLFFSQAHTYVLKGLARLRFIAIAQKLFQNLYSAACCKQSDSYSETIRLT